MSQTIIQELSFSHRILNSKNKQKQYLLISPQKMDNASYQAGQAKGEAQVRGNSWTKTDQEHSFYFTYGHPVRPLCTNQRAHKITHPAPQ